MFPIILLPIAGYHWREKLLKHSLALSGPMDG